MIGWIIGGLLGVAAVAAIVIVVSGKINKLIIQQKLMNKAKNIIVQGIDRCNNVIKLKDLDNDDIYEVHGDSISSDLYEEQKITIPKSIETIL